MGGLVRDWRLSDRSPLQIPPSAQDQRQWQGRPRHRLAHRLRAAGYCRPGRRRRRVLTQCLSCILLTALYAGLFVRPPGRGERLANWQRSSAGAKEDETGWVYVPPVPSVFTVFPGDMLQYVHEPNFRAAVKPLEGYNGDQAPAGGSTTARTLPTYSCATTRSA